MHRNLRLLLLAIAAPFCLALFACGPKAGEEEAVRAVFDQVRAGDFEGIDSKLSPELVTPQTREQFEMLRRDFIPTATPNEVARLNWSWVAVAGGDRTTTAIHQYTYEDRILIVTTVTVTHPDGNVNVAGFHINRLEPAAAQANEFELAGKPTHQIIFLACLAASVALMAIALFGTIFTRSFKRRWLWAIVSLLGAPVLAMNWATGDWETRFSLGLINAGVMRGLSPLAPWIVQFHIPIGALVVLSLLLPRWMKSGDPSSRG